MSKKKTAIKNKKVKSVEESLWQSANSLRGGVESSEYKSLSI
jgi:type I restriction-modification system DNA methylase subunit